MFGLAVLHMITIGTLPIKSFRSCKRCIRPEFLGVACLDPYVEHLAASQVIFPKPTQNSFLTVFPSNLSSSDQIAIRVHDKINLIPMRRVSDIRG